MSMKCVSEWSCLVLLITVIVVSHLKIVQPFQRGFFCDDETIRYPYVSKQTVPPVLLLILCIPIPILIVFTLENHRVWKIWQIRFWTNFGNVVSSFVFGTAITYFFTQTCKLTVGRLRPHFVDVCHPSFNYTIDGVTNQTFTMTLDNFHECPHTQYITDYVCTTGLTATITQARFSFFSGHSSSIAFSMVFVCLVLKNSKLMTQHRIPATCFQAIFISVALFTACSRISDYWHHWQDVIVGLIVGTLTAILIHTFVHRENLRKFNVQLSDLEAGKWCHLSDSLYNLMKPNKIMYN